MFMVSSLAHEHVISLATQVPERDDKALLCSPFLSFFFDTARNVLLATISIQGTTTTTSSPAAIHAPSDNSETNILAANACVIARQPQPSP
jgi:hypothetical protein